MQQSDPLAALRAKLAEMESAVRGCFVSAASRSSPVPEPGEDAPRSSFMDSLLSFFFGARK